MFHPEAVTELYNTNRATLDKLLALETALNARFYGLEAAVRCMMLAALTGEAMVMIGPPGTAKSRLIRAFCSLTRVTDHDPRTLVKAGGTEAARKRDERYFEYLLTQFTEPSELFGYFDLAKLMGNPPALARLELGQMQRAEVVFLDEVFNASSAILNALLTFMNERKFHDRGQVVDTPLKLLFAATNHPPREEGLGAVYDRFLLRCRIENAPAGTESLGKLLSAAWTETHTHDVADHKMFDGVMSGLETFRTKVDELTTKTSLRIDPASPVTSKLADLVSIVRRRELSEMSNRRLVKFSGVVLAQALLRAAEAKSPGAAIEARDLKVLLDYGLDRHEPGTVEKIRQDLLLQ